MTLTIELAPEVERVLEQKAQQRGVRVEQYLVELAERDAQEQDEKIGARLAALNELNELARSMPNNRAGLPELDLSGSRADVYGYSEREESQL